MTVPALADKIEVTEEVLSEILKADALKDARVYISEKLKIERATALQKTSEVDSSISRVIKQNILKEEIGKKVRGKIIAIEGETNSVSSKDSNEIFSKLRTVYVSFDPSCENKECAFKFRIPGEIHSDYSRGTRTYSYYFKARTGDFNLSEIPVVKDMGVNSLKVGRIFKDRKLVLEGTTYSAKNKGVKLLIDLEELRQITIEKKKYKGF